MSNAKTAGTLSFTLKQARRFEQALQQKIEEIHNKMHSAKTAVSKYDDFDTTIDEAEKSTMKAFEVIQDLVELRFNVRRAIQKANESSGLNDLINSETALRAWLRLESVDNIDARTEAEVNRAKARLADMSESESSYRDDVRVNTFSAHNVNRLKDNVAKTKKTIQTVADKCAQLNATVEVTVSVADDVHEILFAHRLL